MEAGGLWLRGSVYFVNFVKFEFVLEARRRRLEHEKGLLSILLPADTTGRLLLLYHMRSMGGGRNGTGAIRVTRFMVLAHREIIDARIRPRFTQRARRSTLVECTGSTGRARWK